jgi:glycosyltransferase involved in cell wall biosynthesis
MFPYSKRRVISSDRPLRLLFLSSYLPDIGGGELQTALQVRILVQRGHHVSVIDLGDNPHAPLQETIDGATIYRYRASANPLLGRFVNQLRLIRLVKSRISNADLIHFNHIGASLPAARLVAALKRVPFILVIWGSARPGIGPFRRGVINSLARVAARSATRIVVLGSETLRNLRRMGFSAERLVLISNGVDLSTYTPMRVDSNLPWRTPPGALRVISIGRLVQAKGYDILLEAWQSIAAAVPCARLALIGEGPERARLMAQVKAAGMMETVQLLGSRRDIPRWLAGADLYVSPSRTEGMSNALLEAIGSGLPVVATRVGGAEDVIDDGVNGCLISPEEVADLATAVTGLLRDRPTLRRMGRASRALAESRFAIDRISDQYESLYRYVLSRR